MRRTAVIAIARLTVRDAVRSRLLVSLTVILLAGLVSLPLLITGDNTLNGQIQVILNYTLSFAAGMLSAVTLWASCGGTPAEMQDHRLYLVLTRPVHRHELWLGKWLGIVFLNLLLLGLSGLTVTGMLWRTVRDSQESPETKRQATERFFLARQSLSPEYPDLDIRAREAADQLHRSGKAPAGMAMPQLQAELARAFRHRRCTIAPAGTVALSYALPNPATGDHDLVLSYRLDSTRPEQAAVPAEWRILVSRDPGLVMPVTNYPGLPNTLLIPGAVVTGASRLTLEYRRRDEGNPATLMMATRGIEPELLIPAGGMAANLARGLFIILCRLAFLAALGLSAGCLLSMPVAVFAAFFILTVMALSGYVETVATTGVFYSPHEGPAAVPGLIDRAVLQLFQALHAVIAPITQLDPVPLLEEGRLVSWPMTARATAWMAGLYSLVTALAGITLFNRREVG